MAKHSGIFLNSVRCHNWKILGLTHLLTSHLWLTDHPQPCMFENKNKKAFLLASRTVSFALFKIPQIAYEYKTTNDQKAVRMPSQVGLHKIGPDSYLLNKSSYVLANFNYYSKYNIITTVILLLQLAVCISLWCCWPQMRIPT